MIAKFQNWYYGEDGMNPIYRMRKFHKIMVAVLIAAAILASTVYEDGELSMQVYGAASFFACFVCIRVLPGVIYGEHWRLGLMIDNGGTALFLLVACFVIGILTAWVITPLYLLLLVSDLRYRSKVKRANPELVKAPKPTHTNLTK